MGAPVAVYSHAMKKQVMLKRAHLRINGSLGFHLTNYDNFQGS